MSKDDIAVNDQSIRLVVRLENDVNCTRCWYFRQMNKKKRVGVDNGRQQPLQLKRVDPRKKLRRSLV